MEDPADSGGGGGGAASEGPAMQVADICWPTGALPLRLLEWKVKPGSLVNLDSVLALCAPISQEKGAEVARLPEKKVKSDRAGVVKELCCQLGQVIPPGGVIVRVEECSHPIVMKGLCAECGQDLTQLQSTNGNQQIPISTATVSMVHSVPELMVSSEGIFHFQLGRGEPMLHTRLRPHCKAFLEKIAKLYELHVFTFGSRLYAHTIAGFLDPEKKLFSHRILSRDECIDPFSKTGNLRNLFPCAGGPSSRPAESTEPGGTLCADEQNNGLSKRPKDQNPSGIEETTTSQSSQEVPTNERTHPTGVVEDESGRGKGKSEAQVGDRTNAKEDDSNRTLVTHEAQDSANSSAPSHGSNNLDFDLSSDSDNDSITEKPPSSVSDSEAKSCQAKNSGQEGVTQEPGDGAREGDSKGGSEAETSLDPAEPSGVLLPDPELGNGCSDRREPETESQNSEQSGVTMGEELLDQSMEDEEDEEEEEEADIDQDDHLIYLEEVLERIHAEYYARYAAYLRKETSETPDIRKIAPELKSKTLEGTTIVFSGLYPTNYPMERTREFYHAKALGAKISKNLVLSSQDPSRTTHLIAARTGTEKVRQAQGCKHLYVVNPDWLSNSPAALPDIQGPLQKHIFHPAPIQPRPQPAAPEVRTYDPVTGKLIRRGPQAPRAPSYLQASGSMMLSDHREQSCLSLHRDASQQDDAAGSSQDEEQPGPSRRKRQPSMSESMPLYMLCKEDLDSMDRE
ncbi:hypothetical protein FQN60_014576, partial [Etheostoma spectabile]